MVGDSQRRFWYLQGEGALVEDLIDGHFAKMGTRHAPKERRTVTTRELLRELDYVPEDRRYRMFVVRNPELRKYEDELLLRLDREADNPRLRVILTGGEPTEKIEQWFTEADGLGEVTEPTIEKMGHWFAAKTIPEWNYYRTYPNALVTTEDGLRLVEYVGWDYAAALQAARTIRAVADGTVIRWELLSALVAPQYGSGYTDALVFGKSRRKALTLSQGVLDRDTRRVLGLVRYYLRQFAKLRAVSADKMSARRVEEETGVHVWHWKERYSRAYPQYTMDRIRLRLSLCEELMVESGPGALEVLALEW